MKSLALTVLLTGACVLTALSAAPAVHGSEPWKPSFDPAHLSRQSPPGTKASVKPQRTRGGPPSLVRAHREKPYAGKALLLEGRAYVALFRRTGRMEDLERAIRCLQEYTRCRTVGPARLEGLRMLKEADSLRRRNALGESGRPSVTADISKQTTRPESSRAPQPVHGTWKSSSGSEHGPNAVFNRPAASSGSSIDHQPSVREPVRATAKPPTVPPTRVAAVPKDATHRVVNEAPSVEHRKPREVIVVIDPGHGGKDPGAVSGDGGIKEKDLTLAIAKRLAERLKAVLPAARVGLTRTDDRFLTLQERTAKANAVNADLFISLHCNADAHTSSRGVETFYLSKAGSLRAMRLAARENGIPLARMNDVEATLLDLMMASKTSESDRLAHEVHNGLFRRLRSDAPQLRNRGVKRAPFYVLLGATMPAILVECGFISNNRETAKLNDQMFSTAAAEGIVSGIGNYIRLQGQGK